MSLVACLDRRAVAAISPIQAGEPEERDHSRRHVWVPDRVDACQHRIPSEVVRQP
jgi:hypothetical protein